MKPSNEVWLCSTLIAMVPGWITLVWGYSLIQDTGMGLRYLGCHRSCQIGQHGTSSFAADARNVKPAKRPTQTFSTICNPTSDSSDSASISSDNGELVSRGHRGKPGKAGVNSTMVSGLCHWLIDFKLFGTKSTKNPRSMYRSLIALHDSPASICQCATLTNLQWSWLAAVTPTVVTGLHIQT